MPEWEQIEYVARFMRACDCKEICALSYSDDPIEAIAALKNASYIGTVIMGRYFPAVAIGAVEMHPGVASVFMFATGEWCDPRVRGAAARYVRTGLFPALLAGGVHRAQAPALLDNVESHKWMRRFGALPEARLRKYGKNGEDFILFVVDDAAMRRVTGVEN